MSIELTDKEKYILYTVIKEMQSCGMSASDARRAIETLTTWTSKEDLNSMV